MIERQLLEKFSGVFILGAVLLIAGCLLAALSLVVRGFMTLAFIVFGLGLATLVFGVLKGLHETMGSEAGNPEMTYEDVYIIAMLRADAKGEMVFVPEHYAKEELQHLVQIEHPDGRKIEYRTSPEVFESMGEGMRGRAIVQGRWLCQFTFKPQIQPPRSTEHVQDRSYRADG